MSLPVEESEHIFCDVQDIVFYLRQNNPSSVNDFIDAFKSTVQLFATIPQIGRPRPVSVLKSFGPGGSEGSEII
jgi:hypothetical protein